VAYTPFPTADPALAAVRVVTMPVQVNGRTRFRLEVTAGLDAASIEAAVRADAQYERWTAGGTVERFVVVPDRIVNVIMHQKASS
jgi:leucyl-tRNA synthetase